MNDFKVMMFFVKFVCDFFFVDGVFEVLSVLLLNNILCGFDGDVMMLMFVWCWMWLWMWFVCDCL